MRMDDPMARKQAYNLYLSAEAIAALKDLAAAAGVAPSAYLEQQLSRRAPKSAQTQTDHAQANIRTSAHMRMTETRH